MGADSQDWAKLPELAGRRVGGAVLAASDEFFAERENLIKPTAPVYRAGTFTHKGQEYDGWETRRRRQEPGDHDWAVVRLGIPGIVRAVVVDTAYFTGNYPPYVSVEGCGLEGYPDDAELAGAEWSTLVPRSTARGDTRNVFPVDDPGRYTHLRLRIYPDGGVARLRVHGEAVCDPRWLAELPLDLAALTSGGRVVGCSGGFYSPADNMLAPGQPLLMSDGWESARRRDAGHDWAVVRLAAPALVRVVEIDTTHFKGNAPERVSIVGTTERRAVPDQQTAWVPVLDPVRLRPDTPHRFRVAADGPLTHLRLNVFPDGGIARFRVYGRLTDDGTRALVRRWFTALPLAQAVRVLVTDCAVDEDRARRIAAGRSAADATLPAEITALFCG